MSDALFEMPAVPTPADNAYRVLARKYRPQSFADLMGQDALVKTLTNAFASGRIAHAFMLTGVRGVGKTTTARIIAKGLNCVEGPTITPCGVCEACTSITAGRCVDVLEMDAASNTGVDDVREIIEGVKYAPASVRTKVYIIDEVHMLSKGAFNALLKTLEEPPPHVKFVFATTEIRKVPVTVLSRCQRFDLKRIEPDALMQLFGKIATAEDIKVSDAALQLLARAADGSARDGLSLLDQAIARKGSPIGADDLRDMLGLADRSQTYDLLEKTLNGQIGEALLIFGEMRRNGVDALIALQDLADAVHAITRHKTLPAEKADATMAADEAVRLRDLATRFTVPHLARAWQVLLKGLQEIPYAPRAEAAAEMVLIRLAHASTLPNPGDLIKQLENAPSGGGIGAPGGGGGSAGGTSALRMAVGSGMMGQHMQAQPVQAMAPRAMSWREVVALFSEKREGQLYAQLYSNVECVSCAWGRLEIRLREEAQPNIVSRISALLGEWTGSRWMVTLANVAGGMTIAEEEQAKVASDLSKASENAIVKAVLLAFPGARIEAVRPPPVPETTTDDVITDFSEEGFDL